MGYPIIKESVELLVKAPFSVPEKSVRASLLSEVESKIHRSFALLDEASIIDVLLN